MRTRVEINLASTAWDRPKFVFFYTGVHQCPICFGAVEVAARVAGCAHVACADCLSRWRVTKDVCPVCEGPVYGVVFDAQLDAENAQRRGLQSF